MERRRMRLTDANSVPYRGDRFRLVQFFRIFALGWLLFVCPFSSRAQIYVYTTNGSSFFFQTNNGTISIWNCVSSVGQIIIPSTINGVDVTDIGGFANLQSVTNILIPDTVVSIGASAFSGCTALATITLGNHVATIPQQCFYNCTHLFSVTMPNATTNIGIGAFASCLDITNVVVGSGVIKIDSSAFQYCYSLLTFTVNAANQAFSSSAGVLFDKLQSKLIQFPPGQSGSYTIPTTVSTIGSNAFFSCYGLTNLTITRNVISIESPVFYNCRSLANLLVDPLNSSFTSLDGVVFNKAGTTIMLFPPGKSGVFSIPSTVTNLAAFAFYGSMLDRVIVTGNVLAIGDSAFNASSIHEVFFLGNAPSVGASLFYGKATAYYMPGTTGWGSTLGNAGAVLWNPHGSLFGVRNNHFGFTVTASTNIAVVVEACASLVSNVWTVVSTNFLTNTPGGGAGYFSDPQLFGSSGRYYRFRSL